MIGLVRERRLELVQQIAVRRVQLEHIETDPFCSQRARDEGFHDGADFSDAVHPRDILEDELDGELLFEGVDERQLSQRIPGGDRSRRDYATTCGTIARS